MHGISLDAQRAGATRWVGTGHSLDHDAARAGGEAVAAAIGEREARLVAVFASSDYDLGALAAAADERAHGALVIGCSTAAELATNAPSETHVTALALGGPGFSVATGAAPIAEEGLREAASSAARCVYEVDRRPHRVLLLLADGLAGDPGEVVRGAYAVAGAGVPLVGGCAGDTIHMRPTHQFHGPAALSGHVVAAALASDAPMGIGVRHGWQPAGEPMLVTEASDTRLVELNDRPALDVYLERTNAPEDARTDAVAFARFAATRPFGISSRLGESAVRSIAAADFDERSLRTIAEIPQGLLIWMMEGDARSALDATDLSCAQALAPLSGAPPLGVLAFDSIGRRGVLGKTGVTEELERIAAHTGGAPLAGFYTYGGIARTHGAAGFHNQALVLLALS